MDEQKLRANIVQTSGRDTAGHGYFGVTADDNCEFLVWQGERELRIAIGARAIGIIVVHNRDVNCRRQPDGIGLRLVCRQYRVIAISALTRISTRRSASRRAASAIHRGSSKSPRAIAIAFRDPC